MSGISQIQMSFVPIEDRILLRLNTVDSQGFAFLMTRRYVKLLWPVLLKMLANDQQITVQQSEQAKKEVLSFKHQQAAQQMDYSQEYKDDNTQQPLGNDPVLLSKIAAKQAPDGKQILSIQPEEGQGIDLTLDQNLLHSICKLLQDTVSKAEWDIDLSQSLASPGMDAEAPPEGRALN